ncbi:MAG: CPBP family intramembrane metalloprotease [Flavobacteriales bacterium]|nr:CPBP family intramembrane metalloprotease [Flavobacteriales bacterium]
MIEEEPDGEQQRRMILMLAGFTITGMPLIAMIIDAFADSFSMSERLVSGIPWYGQLGSGLILGFVFGAVAQFISERRFMQKVNVKYSRMISDLQLNTSEIVFISLCAGVGEEVLFRGALQPLLGVIITAVVFVAIHGYLNPKDWRISVYGVYMTGVIIGLGYATEYLGIWTAVVAHTVIDLYLLRRMKFDQATSPSSESD